MPPLHFLEGVFALAKVLVIDSDSYSLAQLREVLEKAGHEVLAFEDATLALEEVDFNEIGLVITDLVMPTPGD